MKNKKVLVTGATGFLGGHLVPELESRGCNVTVCNSKKYNLLDYEGLMELNEIEFDYIIHLAAFTKAGDWCMYNSAEQWVTNQLINTNIVRYWKEHQSKAKIICMGTSCSYDSKLPLEEEYYEQGTPEDDLYFYGQTKRMLLTGLRAVEKQCGLKWLYVIPSTLYATDFSEDDRHFIFDLARKIHRGNLHGDDVVLWGDGHQKRELIHVNDFIRLLLEVRDVENEVLNLGRGYEISIREYADMLSDLVGFDSSKIKYDETRFVGVLSKKLDITKIKNYVGEVEFTPLKYGLAEIMNWLNEKENRKKVSAN